MKGILELMEDNQWYVTTIEEGDWNTSYQLHPYDVNGVLAADVFNPPMIGREVDFEIVENKKMSGISVYAKIIRDYKLL